MLRSAVKNVGENLEVTIDVKPIINKHSEDMYPSDWMKIVDAIRECSEQGIERVVVTHGTDTLAYTAAAVAIFFQNSGMRICLTGSFRSIDDPKTDSHLNLAAALRWVSEGDVPPGVYVAFRGHRPSMACIFDATDAKPMNFDDVSFPTVYSRRRGTFTFRDGLVFHGGRGRCKDFPCLPECNFPSESAVDSESKNIFMLGIYPGINFDVVRNISTSLNLMIFELYHSGTSNNEFVSVISDLFDKDVGVLVTGYSDRHVRIPYRSTVRLVKFGVPIYKDIQAHFVYVYSVLALAQGGSKADIMRALDPWSLSERDFMVRKN